MDAKERVQRALARAREQGIPIPATAETPRALNGRAGEVRPGFDPWRQTRVSIGPGKELPTWAEYSRLSAALSIRHLRSQVMRGDGKATIAGIALAAKHGLIPPKWLAAAFTKRAEAFLGFEHETLDDAFGIEKLHARARAMEYEKRFLIPAVYRVLGGLLEADPKRAIDKSLFEEAADLFEMNATKCEELYREAIGSRNFANLRYLRREPVKKTRRT